MVEAVCFSPREVSQVVGVAGLTLFVVTWVEAAAFQGVPLRKLGKSCWTIITANLVAANVQNSWNDALILFYFVSTGIRPEGRGLLSWNYHYILTGKGVVGYDPIQGAFSPHLRLQMHLSALFVFWSLLTLLILSPLPKEVIENDYCDTILHMPSTVWTIGLCSSALYWTFFRVLHHVLPGVSVPGGPRRHKIRRTPVWDDKAWERPSALEQWRCVTAQEAHDVSTADFVGTHAVLTGEPAGRDLWTTTTTTTREATHHSEL